jgi:hypothetical protein
MKRDHTLHMHASNQLNLFEPTSFTQKKWAINDIWTPAWNLAISIAIITACQKKWLELKDLADTANSFSVEESNPPFSYQVAHLAKTGKLLERANSKTGNTEWMAA